MMQKKTEKDFNPQARGYWEFSASAIQWIPTQKGSDGFRNFWVLVLWTKVVSVLEGLSQKFDT